MFDTISASVCRCLVTTLGHSLWQAVLLAVICWLVLRLLPARRAGVRYSVACLSLAAVVVASLMTTSWLRAGAGLTSAHRTSSGAVEVEFEERAEGHLSERASTNSGVVETSGNSRATQLPAGSSRIAESSETLAEAVSLRPDSTDHWLYAVSIAWGVGVLLMLTRVIRTVLDVRKLSASVTPEAADHGLVGDIQIMVREVSERLRLRWPVTVTISDRVAVPGVIGTFWPVLLMPPALVTGVPLDQLRIVIAHELAHVRRYDFLINLGQMVVEAVFFFNPAVWWISRQVRIEREACCDAMAVSATGDAVPVARALLDIVARLRDSLGETAAEGFALAAGVQSFADDPRREGSLFDRVKRIIVPDERPHVRLPWYSLIGILAAFALLFAGLYEGADATVKVVQQVLTPKERVDTLVRLKAEKTGIFVPGGIASENVPGRTEEGPKASPSAREKTEQSRGPAEKAARSEVTINIKVRTDDGSPVPRRTQLTACYRTGNSSTSSTLAVVSEETLEFKTSCDVPSCKLVVGGHAPGYATVMSNPLTVFVENGDQDVELILTRGFSAKLKLRSPAGVPVSFARAKVAGRIGIGASYTSVSSQEVKADEHGIVTLQHVSEMLHTVNLRASGFQHAQATVTFEKGKDVEIELKPSKPVSLSVVDDATGQPVSGATAVLCARVYEEPSRRGSHGYGDPRERETSTVDSWRVFGESDEEGQIHLSELRERSRYVFAIQKEGYGTQFVSELRQGGERQTIRLREPMSISGQLTGDLSRLRKRRRGPGKFDLQYENDIRARGHNHSGLFTAVVDKDGKFILPDLIPGKVILRLPDGRKTLVVEKSQTDVTIGIDDTDTPPQVMRSKEGTLPKREVVLRLQGASSEAPARGQLYVAWQTNGDSQNGPLPLVDNEVRMQVPIGIKVSFWARDMVGYRIDKDQERVLVVAGQGPQIVDIPCTPAGAVHGRILRPDGTPAVSGAVMAFAVKLPSGLKRQSDVNPQSRTHSDEFFQSLPYDGTYVMLGREEFDGEMYWGVSREFRIDESNQIQELELQLKKGTRMAVRVLGSTGEPITNAEAQVSLRVECPGTEGGTSFRRGSRTGEFGFASFEASIPSDSIEPLVVIPSVVIPGPSGHAGFSGKASELKRIAPSKYEVKLTKGVSTAGIIIDAKTGRAVPHAEIKLWPTGSSGPAKYREPIETISNARGEFLFDNLEPVDYVVHFEGAMPEGTVITPRGRGYSYHYPDGVTNPRIKGGTPGQVTLRVELKPGGLLKALPE